MVVVTLHSRGHRESRGKLYPEPAIVNCPDEKSAEIMTSGSWRNKACTQSAVYYPMPVDKGLYDGAHYPTAVMGNKLRNMYGDGDLN